ncbi:enoyl-CoA hydratase/carnithine racemase [Desulfosporosinus orientis DSM 765]|uniref:Enoyl-CoA hydratase/carnithine racemase n=1 Tax=Desulfosporosinus orientis (strain ATCC 19365 / DSM 765 / NCIMB 8382 / VKM B-1628 / Singapore I) TaxID=768706 RepID=G7W814_DESOD|nr:enoyl-CoA hydratase/isomerase family protein [Desulfosporosinus orientis]AET66440.1 enoyl-CoA hydratase/carnithine racemase [Desulfosporosinus orientis DSM 765]
MNLKTVNLDIMATGVAVLTFNRPETMNSVNDQLCLDVKAACKEAAENDQVKVLVITGAGKGWSSGGDITSLASMKDPISAKETYDGSGELVTAIYELKKPVIAALNGVVAGASVAACLACDLIIASERARMGFTFMQLAFCPDSGASHFLFQKVGYHKALELLWFGKILDAEEAEKLGLFNKVVPHEECLSEAIRWAEKLALQPLMTVELDKKLMREAGKNNYYQQTELEALYQVLTWSSEDFKEGCAAFAEKRKPVFKNR